MDEETIVLIIMKNGEEIRLKDPSVRARITGNPGLAIWEFVTWQRNVEYPQYCVQTSHTIPIQNIERIEFQRKPGPNKMKENILTMIGEEDD